MAVESDTNLWDKIVGMAVAAVGGMIAYVFRNTNDRINKLENLMVTKEDFERHAQHDEKIQAGIQHELELHRNHVEKIFDMMREMEQASHDNHVALINAINERVVK